MALLQVASSSYTAGRCCEGCQQESCGADGVLTVYVGPTRYGDSGGQTISDLSGLPSSSYIIPCGGLTSGASCADSVGSCDIHKSRQELEVRIENVINGNNSGSAEPPFDAGGSRIAGWVG
tara:strand:+ start:30 stop:392 length:363 start_codon:yes stop_codon:yes gene_type:complete